VTVLVTQDHLRGKSIRVLGTVEGLDQLPVRRCNTMSISTEMSIYGDDTLRVIIVADSRGAEGRIWLTLAEIGGSDRATP
jgi:hypothetical protein